MMFPRSKILFVNTQESRCGNCKTYERVADVDEGFYRSGPDCQCDWVGWSSDYFHIDASFWPDNVRGGIIEMPFIPRSEIGYGR